MFKEVAILVAGVVYDLLVMPLMLLFIPLSYFHSKTRKYAKERSSFWKLYSSLKKGSGNTIVLYCSSVGEFEQVMPLAKMCEKNGKKVVIFFHSKSGLDHCQAMSEFEAYMTPFDLFIGWRLILDKIRPESFIINRHEFWPGAVLSASLLSDLHVVNYVMKQKLSWIDRSVLYLSKKVYSVNDGAFMGNKVLVAGDTRIDRLQDRYKANERKILDLSRILRSNLSREQQLVVVGNSYAGDMEILMNVAEALYLTHKFLVVPSRRGIGSRLPDNTVCFDAVGKPDWTTTNVVVMHTMGNLFEIYGCADTAWIGGGFGQGVHNCLEPDVFGVNMICGPKLGGQPEAVFFLKNHKLHVFENADSLTALLLMLNKGKQQAAMKTAEHSPTAYIYNNLYENHHSR